MSGYTENIKFRTEINRELKNIEVDSNFRYVANPWSSQRVYRKGMIVYHTIEPEVTGQPTLTHWFIAKQTTTQGTFIPGEWEIMSGYDSSLVNTSENAFSSIVVNSNISGTFSSATNGMITAASTQDQFGFVAGSGISLEFDNVQNLIKISRGVGGGESNDGNSLGSGAEVYKDKTGTTLNFRSLTTTGSVLTFTEGTNEIDLSADFSLLNLADLGTKVLSDLDNVASTSPTLNQVLSWNGSSWTPSTIASSTYTATNLGASANSVFSTITANDFKFRRLIETASDPIKMSQSANYITFSWDGSEISINDIGDVNLTSIQAGQGLVYNSGTSKWENTNTINSITTAGSGVALFQGAVSGVAEFSSLLTANNLININELTDGSIEIEFSLDALADNLLGTTGLLLSEQASVPNTNTTDEGLVWVGENNIGTQTLFYTDEDNDTFDLLEQFVDYLPGGVWKDYENNLNFAEHRDVPYLSDNIKYLNLAETTFVHAFCIAKGYIFAGTRERGASNSAALYKVDINTMTLQQSLVFPSTGEYDNFEKMVYIRETGKLYIWSATNSYAANEATKIIEVNPYDITDYNIFINDSTSPGTGASGSLCSDGTYLYTADGNFDPKVKKFRLSDGVKVAEITLDGTSGTTRSGTLHGMETDGEYLFVSTFYGKTYGPAYSAYNEGVHKIRISDMSYQGFCDLEGHALNPQSVVVGDYVYIGSEAYKADTSYYPNSGKVFRIKKSDMSYVQMDLGYDDLGFVQLNHFDGKYIWIGIYEESPATGLQTGVARFNPSDNTVIITDVFEVETDVFFPANWIDGDGKMIFSETFNISTLEYGVARFPVSSFASNIKKCFLDSNLNLIKEFNYETGVIRSFLNSYADDADAGYNGLEPGDEYQTDGTGAAPLNIAGIKMIKQ
jgi:hypothetical protein